MISEIDKLHRGAVLHRERPWSFVLGGILHRENAIAPWTALESDRSAKDTALTVKSVPGTGT